MAITPIRIPKLNQGLPIVDQDGRPTVEFFRRLGEVFDTITDAVNAVIDAQNAADAAQSSADGAQATANQAVTDAATAQTQADAAYNLAGTKVTKNVGPAWLNATGAASRGAYASFSALVIDPAYNQAQIQGVADAVQSASQALVALINDGIGNESLTS